MPFRPRCRPGQLDDSVASPDRSAPAHPIATTPATWATARVTRMIDDLTQWMGLSLTQVESYRKYIRTHPEEKWLPTLTARHARQSAIQTETGRTPVAPSATVHGFFRERMSAAAALWWEGVTWSASTWSQTGLRQPATPNPPRPTP